MTANQMWTQLLIEYEKINSNRAPGIVDFGPNNEATIILSKAQRSYVQMFLSSKANTTKEGFDETELRKQGLSELIKDGAGTTTISADQTGVLGPDSTFWDLPMDFMYTILERAEIDKFDCTKYPNAVYKGQYDSESGYIKDDVVLYEGLFYISLSSQTNVTPPSSNWKQIYGIELPIRTVSHNEYNKYIYNPFKNPYFDGTKGLVWRIQYSREINNDAVGPNVVQSNKRHELVTNGAFDIINYKLRYLKNPDDIIVDMQDPNNQQHCKLDDRTHDIIISIAVNQLSEYLREQRPKAIVENYTIE